MLATHDIAEGSFSVFKVEVVHRPLDFKVGRNPKITSPTFLLFTSLLRTALALGIEVRESEGPSETQIPDRTKGCGRQSHTLPLEATFGQRKGTDLGVQSQRTPNIFPRQ